MDDSEILDSTEKIRNRLEVEYEYCGRALMDSVYNCLAYKTSEHRPAGRKPAVCPQWEHFQSVMMFRESLSYRLGSLAWHCRQFQSHQKEHAERISALKIKREDHQNEMRDAFYIVSYLLDDIVFCSVSIFDYLAQLVFKLNCPEKKGKKYWNELVKQREFEDPRLAQLVRDTNADFVHNLSKLRGRSIHTQADIGGLRLGESYGSMGITHSFDFLMPREARRALPIFDENKEFSIEPGAYLIALHTLVGVRNILVQLGKYEYTCVYYPFRKT